MSECAVCFCHTVHIFFTLESTTLVVECIYNFGRQFVRHRLTTTLTCKNNQILHRNRLFTIRADLSRNLESSTSYAARLHLYLRCDVIESCLPYFKSRLFFIRHLGLYRIQCGIKDFKCGILLTVIHQVVNEFRHLYITENRIW